MIRSYKELMHFNTLEERFEYLKLNGKIGEETFGFERYLNQKFYRSSEWKKFRDKIITRDLGCELGMQGNEIEGYIYVHHINPITLKDIETHSSKLLNSNNVICCSEAMHKAIHYGNNDILIKYTFVERKKNDTSPWKEV